MRGKEGEAQHVQGKASGESGAGIGQGTESRQDVETVEAGPPAVPDLAAGVGKLQDVAGEEAHPFLIEVSPGMRGIRVIQIAGAREGDDLGVAVADVEGDVRVIHFVVVNAGWLLDEVLPPRQIARPE